MTQGADLHSFLESLRQPGRTPGHGVRQLHRISDFSVLPSFLTAQQDAFSFRFSESSGRGGVGAGEETAAETQTRAGTAAGAERQAWGACVPVRDASLRRDHSSLQVRKKSAESPVKEPPFRPKRALLIAAALAAAALVRGRRARDRGCGCSWDRCFAGWAFHARGAPGGV